MLRTSFQKCIAAILSFAVILSLFTVAAPVFSAAESFYDTAVELPIKDNIEEDASLSEYATAQGSCSDGKYAYVAIQNGSTTIVKYDLNTFQCVEKSDSISGLGHANDLTYNTKEKFIAVANNAPDYDVITLISPDDFSEIKSVKIKLDIYSIAYSEKLDSYFVGVSGGYDFARLDKDFNVVKEYKGVDTGYTRQGCDCDGEYIYFAQSGGGGNVIVIYTPDGAYVDTISIDNSDEIENIFHSGSSFYATFHYYGNFIYRLGLSDQKRITKMEVRERCRIRSSITARIPSSPKTFLPEKVISSRVGCSRENVTERSSACVRCPQSLSGLMKKRPTDTPLSMTNPSSARRSGSDRLL